MRTITLAAAFALAVYPAALKGALPVGAEGLGDLARRAAPLLHVDGKLEWREPLSQSGTSHPELPRVAAAIAALECPARRARARRRSRRRSCAATPAAR